MCILLVVFGATLLGILRGSKFKQAGLTLRVVHTMTVENFRILYVNGYNWETFVAYDFRFNIQ